MRQLKPTDLKVGEKYSPLSHPKNIWRFVGLASDGKAVFEFISPKTWNPDVFKANADQLSDLVEYVPKPKTLSGTIVVFQKNENNPIGATFVHADSHDELLHNKAADSVEKQAWLSTYSFVRFIPFEWKEEV